MPINLPRLLSAGGFFIAALVSQSVQGQTVINEGETLTLTGANINGALATIVNNGTLNNNGTFSNIGELDSDGALNNNWTLNNYG